MKFFRILIGWLRLKTLEDAIRWGKQVHQKKYDDQVYGRQLYQAQVVRQTKKWVDKYLLKLIGRAEADGQHYVRISVSDIDNIYRLQIDPDLAILVAKNRFPNIQIEVEKLDIPEAIYTRYDVSDRELEQLIPWIEYEMCKNPFQRTQTTYWLNITWRTE